MATDLAPVFDAAGKAFNVDPNLLAAVAQTESSGNPQAVSPAGAIGTMQFMPQTAAVIGIDPTDPVQSVWGAANLLDQNRKQFGNMTDALRAYNGGTDPAKWNNPETAAYVSKVAAHYQAAQPQPAANDFGQATGTMSAAPASAQDAQDAVDPLGAGNAQASAPAADAYTALFGSTAPSAKTADTTATAPAAANTNTPDAYSALFGSTSPNAPHPPQASWHQGGYLAGAARLTNDAVNAAGGQIDKGIAWGVDHIPGAQSVLAGTELDPQKLLDADAAQQAQQAQQPGGATANAIGQAAGNMLGAGLAVETGAGALGLGGNALAAGVGGTAGRAVQAGTNLLTGAGRSTLARLASAAIKGGAGSAILGGDPTQIAEGAAGGAALGAAAPYVGNALGSIGGAIGRGASGLVNKLAPADDTAGAAGVNRLAPGAPTSTPAATDTIPPTPPGMTSAPPADAALTSTDPAAAAPDAAPSAPQTPPEAVKLGLFSSPDDAAKFGQTAYDNYAAGGPTQLIQSKIPGVQLTAAQATGNPGLALLERNRRAANPTPFTMLDQQNAAARNAFAQQVVGTPEQLDQARGALTSMDAQARPQVFGQQQPVPTQPIVDDVQAAIDANKGRPTVQAPLQNVLAQIQSVSDESGNAAPADLWNVRKYLGDMVAPRAAGTANDGQAAAAQLLNLKPTIDTQIEQGAPGFQNYLQQYSAMSKPIDAMEYLQSKLPTDAQGNVPLGKLDTFIKGIDRSQNKSGYSQADAVTPDQYQALTDLRDDMRLGSRIDIGKARGSDTNVNLYTTSKVANMMQGATPKVASLLTGGAGALAGAPVEGGMIGLGANYLSSRLAAAQANRLAAVRSGAEGYLDNRLLNPYGN